jgi:serine/threonine protein kinase
MNQCLNPDCLAVNLEVHRFCQKCGSSLWLKNRYQALKLIGQGGFGKTFLAIDHDKPSKPQCVIKQFFPQGQGTGGLQKAAELFAEEAKRLDELGKHPQIPELLAYFIHEDKRQYLVQEYIAGQNLEQELKSQGNFTQDKIRALLLDLLPVLDFIHQRQVIHRDIKPENIIRRAQDNKLVLVDFGAAKAVTPVNRSVTGTMIGSAEYVAPEQMNGKAVNASDLYNLGVTCLYLLTGISPFDLFDMGEHEWCWRDYLVNNSVNHSINDNLANVLDKLVSKGTKKRYQSVGQVIQDLSLKSEPIKQTTKIQSSSSHSSKSNPSISSKTKKLIPIIQNNPSESSIKNQSLLRLKTSQDSKETSKLLSLSRRSIWVNILLAITPYFLSILPPMISVLSPFTWIMSITSALFSVLSVAPEVGRSIAPALLGANAAYIHTRRWNALMIFSIVFTIFIMFIIFVPIFIGVKYIDKLILTTNILVAIDNSFAIFNARKKLIEIKKSQKN